MAQGLPRAEIRRGGESHIGVELGHPALAGEVAVGAVAVAEPRADVDGAGWPGNVGEVVGHQRCPMLLSGSSPW